tara:strand:- start:493 stop:1098 length:606 start_codon:yes stop_codon:yes gene_type:complete
MAKKWTKKEDNKIIRLWKQGLTIKDIAEQIEGRSLGAVTARTQKLRRKGIIDGRQQKTTKDKKKPILSSSTKKNLQKAFKHYGDSPFTLPHKPYSVQQDAEDRKYMTDSFKTNDSSAMKIIKTMEDIRLFLIKKNEQYGDSALEPIRIFSKASKSEQLRVRIDDKLNRLVQGNADIESDDDVVKDLIGYLVLLLIHMKENQ